MSIVDYLKKAVEANASDVFITAGAPVTQKAGGSLQKMSSERLLPPDTKELISSIYELAGRDITSFLEKNDDDFSFSISDLARFRVSAYRQRNSLAAVIRIVSFSIPPYESMGIPEQVMKLANVSSGLILFTGTAGSGKSTTQACLIDRINHTRSCHIITLEDPIEYLHRNDKSIVSQREISIDTQDCLCALRASLRQAPDVILLGEMRDSETIRTAITAAETGHTVIATLHTKGTANCIDRIIDAFPAQQQAQIKAQLSLVLHTAVSQQLIPAKDGSLIPAFEIMHANSAIKNLIRDGNTHQIPSAIMTFKHEGMLSMDESLYNLYCEGKITREVALENSDNYEQMLRRLDA